MLQTIVVEPSGAGWIVGVRGLMNQMFFANGRNAEIAARDLATRLADVGEGVEVEIRIRGGAIAGKYFCFPPAANEHGRSPAAAATGAVMAELES